MRHSRLLVFALAVCIALVTLPACADTIAWTHWTSVTPSNATGPGSGIGTIGSIDVTYSGQTSALLMNYPSWTPTSSYIGGAVGNGPPAANNSIQLEGGVTYTESITFSSPVVDPVMAIWSLGAPGNTASFVFTSSEPFSVVAGGPSAEYGGSSITKSGNSVFGAEGNGVVQFDGTFSTITFTTPSFENFYAFTVGQDVSAGPIPEPGTLSLLGLGLTALPLLRKALLRRRA